MNKYEDMINDTIMHLVGKPTVSASDQMHRLRRHLSSLVSKVKMEMIREDMIRQKNKHDLFYEKNKKYLTF